MQSEPERCGVCIVRVVRQASSLRITLTMRSDIDDASTETRQRMTDAAMAVETVRNFILGLDRQTGDLTGDVGVTSLRQTRRVAGFGSIAAVGKSLEMVLNARFAAVEPIVSENAHAQLIQTEDLDPGSHFLIRPTMSILLYRVDFNKTMRASWSAVGATDGRAHLPVDLHYLLTAWADNADHEHRLIGRTLEIFEELGSLSGPLLHPDGNWSVGEAVQLYLEDVATDDLMRTFESLACDFRLSIPYIARVVVVSTPSGDALPDVLTQVRGMRPDPGSGGTGTSP
ncbi:MAG TPA: Pvc16 family protein [Streptosporangiaceae bacterium]|nr:Pvc16 family protein [Streptosporangiaceae bacterium]